jgi:hypothetical protein
MNFSFVLPLTAFLDNATFSRSGGVLLVNLSVVPVFQVKRVPLLRTPGAMTLSICVCHLGQAGAIDQECPNL